MEPQVWVPWIVAVLAPAAVLLSQWMGSRDRAADREHASGVYWRDQRLAAHREMLAGLQRKVERLSANVLYGEVQHDLAEDETGMSDLLAALDLLAGENTIAAARASLAAVAKAAEDQEMRGLDAESWFGRNGERKAVLRTISAYRDAVRFELGTAPVGP